MGTPINGQPNGLYSYDSFNQKSKPKSFHFLWWCAGSEQGLLREYPSEQTKHAGLGGVLLATFILAALAGGYALYSVFGNILVAILFGILWGLIIFNLDRFLVSTMRKYGVSRGRQVWMAVPRIILALLIGFTIARPLELKIFEKEINIKVAENMHKKIQKNDSLLHAEEGSVIMNAEKERRLLQARRSAIEDSLHNLQQSYVQEADGTGGSGFRGIESITRLKMNAYRSAYERYTPELSQIADGLRRQDSIIANSRAGTEEKRSRYQASLGENIGFLERNKALSDLNNEESSVFWACLFISLLIIMIETAPVVSKLIMQSGPYDIALAKQELLQMAAAENDIRRDKANVYDKQAKMYDEQKEISTELVRQLTELQRKHIREDLEKWERGEITEMPVKKNLDEVIKKIKERYYYSADNLL